MSEQRSGPDFDPELDKHEGSIAAMNADRGGKADADREPAPGNVGWEVPYAEADENIEGGVRAASADQNGAVKKLPQDLR
jgi:hypothetical protein